LITSPYTIKNRNGSPECLLPHHLLIRDFAASTDEMQTDGEENLFFTLVRHAVAVIQEKAASETVAIDNGAIGSESIIPTQYQVRYPLPISTLFSTPIQPTYYHYDSGQMYRSISSTDFPADDPYVLSGSRYNRHHFNALSVPCVLNLSTTELISRLKREARYKHLCFATDSF